MAIVDVGRIIDVCADFKRQVAVGKLPDVALLPFLKGRQQLACVHDLSPDNFVLQDAQELVAKALQEKLHFALKIPGCGFAHLLEKGAKFGNVHVDGRHHKYLCWPFAVT